MLAIDIPLESPSLNELLRWGRRQPWRYGKFRDSVTLFLRFSLVQLGMLPKERCDRRMRVKFIRYSAGTLDDQNLRGGFKPTCDALVKLGVLKDDSPKWLVDTYEQVKTRKGDKRMRLEIRAAE